MSNLDYSGAIFLQNEKGFQEIYSSRNYETFYSLYIDFVVKKNKDNDKILTEIKFKIVNYKGVINLGIERIEHEYDTKDKSIDFKIDVQAFSKKRLFHYVDKSGSNIDVKIDKSKFEFVRVIRNLKPMPKSFYNPARQPNHTENLAFDDEFYYRDGEEFDKSKNERTKRGGMDGSGGGFSGKRCYGIILKTIY